MTRSAKILPMFDAVRRIAFVIFICTHFIEGMGNIDERSRLNRKRSMRTRQLYLSRSWPTFSGSDPCGCPLFFHGDRTLVRIVGMGHAHLGYCRRSSISCLTIVPLVCCKLLLRKSHRDLQAELRACSRQDSAHKKRWLSRCP